MTRVRSLSLLPALAAAAALLGTQPASAQGWRGDYGYGDPRYGYDAPPPPRYARDDDAPPAYYGRGGGYDAPPPPVYYGRRGYDAPPPAAYPADYGPRGYRPAPRRYRCGKGTGGTILGAIAGGLLGNGIAGRGDRGAGTIIGAGVGALAGRAIDRNC